MTNPTIHIGKITIDTGKKTVKVGVAPIRLSINEYKALEVLAENEGKTVTREAILTHIAHRKIDPADAMLANGIIQGLRENLKAATGKNYIETFSTAGFVLRDPEGGK